VPVQTVKEKQSRPDYRFVGPEAVKRLGGYTFSGAILFCCSYRIQKNGAIHIHIPDVFARPCNHRLKAALAESFYPTVSAKTGVGIKHAPT
jgi:hypothetical protein